MTVFDFYYDCYFFKYTIWILYSVPIMVVMLRMSFVCNNASVLLTFHCNITDAISNKTGNLKCGNVSVKMIFLLKCVIHVKNSNFLLML